MRQVTIGGEVYTITASPLTLHFYKKEFGTDILGDLMIFDGLEDDPSNFSAIALLQMAWAMHKTAKMGQVVGFEQWIADIETVDFEDEDMIIDIISEAREQFFRKGEQPQGQSR